MPQVGQRKCRREDGFEMVLQGFRESIAVVAERVVERSKRTVVHRVSGCCVWPQMAGNVHNVPLRQHGCSGPGSPTARLL